MNDIILDKIPEDYYYKLLDKGCSGTCYLTAYNDVYKELRNYLLDYYCLQGFTNIKNESFVFPKQLVYLHQKNKESLVGYRREYIEGTIFKDLDFNNIKIMDYIQASDKVEKDIKNLVFNDSILIDDINPANVIYTNDNRFMIIDTDLYSFAYSNSIIDTYRVGLKEWSELVTTIVNHIFPVDNDELNKLYYLCVRRGIKPSDLLYEMLKEMNYKTQQEIITVNDFKENVRVLKNNCKK